MPLANLRSRRVISRALLRRRFRLSGADISIGLSGANLVAFGSVWFAVAFCADTASMGLAAFALHVLGIPA
jgi:hypothetical protein